MTMHNTNEDGQDPASIHCVEVHAGAQALERLGILVAEVLEETGLTEDELVAEIVGARNGRTIKELVSSGRPDLAWADELADLRALVEVDDRA